MSASAPSRSSRLACAPKDRFGEVRSLFDWVRRNVRYTRDIFRVELLHTPRRMLELRPATATT